MAESLKRFNHEQCAREYIDIYEKMLHRHLVRNFAGEKGEEEEV